MSPLKLPIGSFVADTPSGTPTPRRSTITNDTLNREEEQKEAKEIRLIKDARQRPVVGKPMKVEIQSITHTHNEVRTRTDQKAIEVSRNLKIITESVK